MILQKKRQRELELGDSFRSLDSSPTPPLHHKKWNIAHQRPRGEFTSQVTRKVAKNIVSRYFFQYYLFQLIQIGKDGLLFVLQDLLVEKSNDDTFITQQHHDILVEMIETEEHGGCVCGLGRSINLRIFFRSLPKSYEVMRMKEIE